ncbi:TPA: hypothetical protein ACGIK9_002830 [Acinetobacter baumannii]|uniref:hypothetical protein n=1 Tax=Acinetobacter baumannii TaxID=470 RepID=UPI00338D95C8
MEEKINYFYGKISHILRMSLILLFTVSILIVLFNFIPLSRGLRAFIIVMFTFAGGLFSGVAIVSYCVIGMLKDKNIKLR